MVTWNNGIYSVDFIVYEPLETRWHNVAGIYWFANLQGSVWVPQYIGQCTSFANRMPPKHERWVDALLAGSTHILAVAVPDEEHRTDLETAMIGHTNPRLNTQHRTNADLAAALLRRPTVPSTPSEPSRQFIPPLPNIAEPAFGMQRRGLSPRGPSIAELFEASALRQLTRPTPGPGLLDYMDAPPRPTGLRGLTPY